MRKWIGVLLALLWAGQALAQVQGGPGVLPAIQRPATAIILGDSITANADYTNAAVTTCTTQCGANTIGSYWTWAQFYSSYRLWRPPGYGNYGYSGYTTTQVAAFVPAAIASNPSMVLFQIGGNDVGAGQTCAQITANIRTLIYQPFQAAHIPIISVGIYPRSSPNTFTTAQANVAQCVNQFNRNYSQENPQTTYSSGVYFVDLDPTVIDPTQSSWAIRSGYLYDGTHPSMIGGSAMGYTIAQVIDAIVPQVLFPAYSQGDVYDATNNPVGNLIGSDGQFAGTSGTVSSGCTTSSGVANHWNVYEANVTGEGCVATLTTEPDGRTCQVVTLSGTYTGSNAIVYLQDFGHFASLNVGDTVQARAMISVGSNTNIANIDLMLQTNEASTNYYQHGAGTSNLTSAIPSAGWANGGFIPIVTPARTVTGTVTLGSTGVSLNIQLISPGSASTVAGTITVCSVEVRKVLP